MAWSPGGKILINRTLDGGLKQCTNSKKATKYKTK